MKTVCTDYLSSFRYDIFFQLLLHNPVETPKIADYGMLIAPGREYRLKITPTINNAAKSLHNVKERNRQCAYSGDKYLLFYKTYTQKNCMLECESNYTLLVCNCVPFYLPSTWLTTGFFLPCFLRFSFFLYYLRHCLSFVYLLFCFSKFLGVGWDWVHLVCRPLFGLLYQPRMIDDDNCGTVGGIRIGRGHGSTRGKPAPVPFVHQKSHMTWPGLELFCFL
jgi:hypothetical protein